jgi:hypothetical protein
MYVQAIETLQTQAVSGSGRYLKLMVDSYGDYSVGVRQIQVVTSGGYTLTT